jgi:hypothetical protein
MKTDSVAIQVSSALFPCAALVAAEHSDRDRTCASNTTAPRRESGSVGEAVVGRIERRPTTAGTSAIDGTFVNSVCDS